MKVCILGNSVALRVRPPRALAGPCEERTYAEWLEQAGHQVRAVAAAGVMLSEAYATLDDDVITWFPDVVVINHGVVEVCYRQTIRWLNNRTITNYYLNRTFAEPYRFDSGGGAVAGFLWRSLNALTRRAAAMLGLRWQWMETARFLRVLEDTIASLLQETRARVIVLPINPCSPRVERVLAGSNEAIADTNARMAALVARLGDRVEFVPPGELFSGDGCSVDDLVPDGVHYSAAGHHRVAEILQARLARAR